VLKKEKGEEHKRGEIQRGKDSSFITEDAGEYAGVDARRHDFEALIYKKKRREGGREKRKTGLRCWEI